MFVIIDIKYYIIKILAENDKYKLVLNNSVFEMSTMCDVISVNYCLFILLLIIVVIVSPRD